VTVKLSSFSGSRLPFFSITFPIDMRPSMGGGDCQTFDHDFLLIMALPIPDHPQGQAMQTAPTERGN
jgi:hypothetical protein